MGEKEENELIQENIQEFVYDDNKVVTCKWLSLTLSIPINSAKHALYEFASKARNEGNNDDVNVSYFLSGFDTKEGGSKILKCIVVPESHLDSVKQTLDPLTSCHVYSVQKAQLKDYTALYQADYDICKENTQALSKFSSITCPWAVRRENQTHEQDSTTKKSNEKGLTETKPITTSDEKSSLSSSKTSAKKVDNKKGGIASMFAKAEKKKTEAASTAAKDGNNKTASSAAAKDENNKTTAPKAKESTEKKGMESFLKGQTAGSKVKKETSPNLKPNQTKTKSTDSKADKSQKHKLSEKEEPQRKKRRRIRNDLFDSSDEEKNKSDDEDDDNDDDVNVEESEDEDSKLDPSSDNKDGGAEKETDVIEEEDEPEVEKEKEKSPKRDGGNKTAEKESVSGKKRKRTRKLVPRQHIDEDGFMVTEKVWESDSTDASEDEVVTKPTKTVSPVKSNVAKAAPQNKKKPAVSPSKNKQTSLMSFFKKK